MCVISSFYNIPVSCIYYLHFTVEGVGAGSFRSLLMVTLTLSGISGIGILIQKHNFPPSYPFISHGVHVGIT